MPRRLTPPRLGGGARRSGGPGRAEGETRFGWRRIRRIATTARWVLLLEGGVLAGNVVGSGALGGDVQVFDLGVRSVQAQAEPPPAPLALVAGPTRYALQERRTGAVVALRLASPFEPLGIRNWLLEPGLAYGWYRTDPGERRHVVFSELQLQAQTGDRLRPYAGVGGGLAVGRRESNTTAFLSFSAGAGVRIAVGERWGIVGDFRVRRTALFRRWNRELTAGFFAVL